MTLGKV